MVSQEERKHDSSELPQGISKDTLDPGLLTAMTWTDKRRLAEEEVDASPNTSDDSVASNAVDRAGDISPHPLERLGESIPNARLKKQDGLSRAGMSSTDPALQQMRQVFQQRKAELNVTFGQFGIPEKYLEQLQQFKARIRKREKDIQRTSLVGTSLSRMNPSRDTQQSSHILYEANLTTEDSEGSEQSGYISEEESYPASLVPVFSVASLASSASELSKTSSYSATQIASATKELLSIFEDDETLQPLYEAAYYNPSIGPVRLQRNLRRLLQTYAEQLKNEAKDNLEYLAARLVFLKAELISQAIVEKLKAGNCITGGSGREAQDSSDEEGEEESRFLADNEGAFEDLIIPREFLVSGDAFQLLRKRIEAFCTSNQADLSKENRFLFEAHTAYDKPTNSDCLSPEEILRQRGTTSPEVKSWSRWQNEVVEMLVGHRQTWSMSLLAQHGIYLAIDAIYLLTDNTFISSGFLEPVLQPNKVRIRWSCTCGDTFYSDVEELYPGGVEQLIRRMKLISGANACPATYNSGAASQRYIAPNPFRWLNKAITKVVATLSKASNAPVLPQHNHSCSAAPSASPHTNSPQRSLYLLACMHRSRTRRFLQQYELRDITTDRSLLSFLRQQYARHRGRLLLMLSLKSIKGIHLNKFRLPIGGSVDVRYHPGCITSTANNTICECIPPQAKVLPSPTAEYDCVPGPPATNPPMPPEYLASLFSCLADVHEADTWIFKHFPKRICGKLQGQIGQPAEGWGIYYQEGWDRDMITLLIFLEFLVASMIFGIMWTVYKSDMQAAFGVSAYIMTACSIIITLISTYAEK